MRSLQSGGRDYHQNYVVLLIPIFTEELPENLIGDCFHTISMWTITVPANVANKLNRRLFLGCALFVLLLGKLRVNPIPLRIQYIIAPLPGTSTRCPPRIYPIYHLHVGWCGWRG